jgi:hypothetical protein
VPNKTIISKAVNKGSFFVKFLVSANENKINGKWHMYSVYEKLPILLKNKGNEILNIIFKKIIAIET